MDRAGTPDNAPSWLAVARQTRHDREAATGLLAGGHGNPGMHGNGITGLVGVFVVGDGRAGGRRHASRLEPAQQLRGELPDGRASLITTSPVTRSEERRGGEEG